MEKEVDWAYYVAPPGSTLLIWNKDHWEVSVYNGTATFVIPDHVGKAFKVYCETFYSIMPDSKHV